MSQKTDAKYCGKNSPDLFRACPPVLILFHAQFSLNRGREPAWIIECDDHLGLMPLMPFIDHHAVASLLVYENSGLHRVAGRNL